MTNVALHIIPRDQHPISRKLIHPSALKVIYRLQEHGYEAYLVGGGVRDILLGVEPKDFDVATSATPEEVKRLFSNARLIGRRFKLVHVLFGRDVIEVATFRASSEAEENTAHTKRSEHGMLLRDNVYGTVEDDAIRRDFTINALYYNPKDFAIYDYLDALSDIQTRTLRMIGDPATRYREDPVRMLRAIRFSSKLDLAIEPNTRDPIYDMAPLIRNVAAARLFDEVIKLFITGNGEDAFNKVCHFGMFDLLFPSVGKTMASSPKSALYKRFIVQALSNTNERIRQNKPVTPAFLYAALLWPEVDRLWEQSREDKKNNPQTALDNAAQSVLLAQSKIITIPKHFLMAIRDIWNTQQLLTRTDSKHALQTLGLPKFRAAYDFLLLREQAGESLNNLGQFWTHFQEQNPAPERGTVALLPETTTRPKRRRRPPRKAQ